MGSDKDAKIRGITSSLYEDAKAAANLPMAVCTEVLNEGPYLREWVHFHRRMGMTKFYLFDNGSNDDTAKEANLLSDLGVELVDRSALVTDADYEGDQKATVESGVADQLAFLSACTRHAHQQLGKAWVWNFDVDEFIVSPDPDWKSTGSLSIVHKLNDIAEQGGSQIQIARRIFGSSGKLWPCEGAVTQCYTQRMSRSATREQCQNAFAASRRSHMLRAQESNDDDDGEALYNTFFKRYCANYAEVTYGKFAVLSDAVARMSQTWGVETKYGKNVTCDEANDACGLSMNHYQLKSMAEFLERTGNQSAWAPKFHGHPEQWFAAFDELANVIEDDNAAVQLGEWYSRSTYEDGSHRWQRPLEADTELGLYPRTERGEGDDDGDDDAVKYYPESMRSQLRKSFDHCETGRDKPLGVLLLGMHHSGTSTMAGLLIRSGLYGGKSGELLVKKDLLKYWEHAPTVRANQKLYVEQMRNLGQDPKVLDDYSDTSGAWTGSHFDLANTTTAQLAKFVVNAAKSVRTLVCPAKPFVLKDPRLTLTTSLWTGAFKQRAQLMCLIMWRPANKVAEAMVKHHFCTNGGSHAHDDCTSMDEPSLFELTALHAYTALHSCAAEDLPTTIVPHASLLNTKAILSSTLNGLASVKKGADADELPNPTGDDAMHAAQAISEHLDANYFSVRSDSYDDTPETMETSPRALAVNLVLSTHVAPGPGSSSRKEPIIVGNDVAKYLAENVAKHEHGLKVLSAWRNCKAKLNHYLDMQINMMQDNDVQCNDTVLTKVKSPRVLMKAQGLATDPEDEDTVAAMSDPAPGPSNTHVVRRFLSEKAEELADVNAEFALHHKLDSTTASYTGPVWLAWTTNASMFGKMQAVVLQSIFRHNVGARVSILSNTLNPETDGGDVDVINRLARAGYDISVKPLPVEELKKHLPKFDPANPFAYSHLTDVLRYYQINKYGGVYQDFDMVATNPWTDMPQRFFHLQEDFDHPPPHNKVRSEYTADEPYTWLLNTAFMRFEKGAKLLELLLYKCAQYHKPTDWTSVGNKMVMTELGHMRAAHARGETKYDGYDLNDLLDFRMLDMDEAAPVPWLHVKSCNKAGGSECGCSANFHHGYVFHLYGHANEYDTIEAHSCLYRLYTEHLVFAEDAESMLVPHKAPRPGSRFYSEANLLDLHDESSTQWDVTW